MVLPMSCVSSGMSWLPDQFGFDRGGSFQRPLRSALGRVQFTLLPMVTPGKQAREAAHPDVGARAEALTHSSVMSHKFVHTNAGPCLGWQSASRSTQMVLDSHCGVVGNLEWPAPTRARE